MGSDDQEISFFFILYHQSKTIIFINYTFNQKNFGESYENL